MVFAQTATVNATSSSTSTGPCSTFNPFECASEQLDAEHQFLALVIVALAAAVCVLCLLACLLAVLVHKTSVLWMSVALGNNAAEKGDAHDARKGLLGHVKSSLAPRDRSGAKKGKRATFAEDTSCAPPRDVDEEDL